MNLYLISQEEYSSYDTFDSAVVCVENEEAARNIHPYANAIGPVYPGHGSWCTSPDKVTVQCLGEAVAGTPRGVICSSFNAG